MGDGNLEFNGFKGTRLQVKQAKNKKEYVLWLHRHFIDIVRTPPKQRQDTLQWYFGTRYIEEFTVLRNTFYQKGRKIVPQTIHSISMSPVTLAVWYMDDGRLDYREKSHYAYILSTDTFTFKEVGLLQNLLFQKFRIRSSIQSSLCRGKRYPKLYIGRDGRDKFFQTISPHILHCFSYKLPPHNIIR